ncbi:MAG: hypothetical protein HY549_00245 [Elusimicrobia bacterium]|nr:hypothetical protein [Elusimicrobiota bacterium]
MRSSPFWASAVLLGAIPVRALDWVPLLDSAFLLGQTYQQGRATSWQGNASLQFTPAVKLSDRLALIPTYSGKYQGSKNAAELLGGSQLFQDSQSHSVSVKGVWRVGEFKIKPSAGYRWEMLRETKDETWGKGLFDYRKPSAGVELERAFGQYKVGAGFDYYEIRFPNYSSLDSSQFGGSLGREQSQGHTLDSRNLSGTLSGTVPLPFEGGAARLALNLTERSYPEQFVVVESGGLSAEKRQDDSKSASGTFYYGRSLGSSVAGLFSVQVMLSRYRSNQNHYDAELNLFNKDYYSYEERSVQPRIALAIGERRVEASLSYLWIERDYLTRLAQVGSGSYTEQTVRLTQSSFLADLGVPIGAGFKAVSQLTVSHSQSNMRYEKTFRYNYEISSALVGLSYSF